MKYDPSIELEAFPIPSLDELSMGKIAIASVESCSVKDNNSESTDDDSSVSTSITDNTLTNPIVACCSGIRKVWQQSTGWLCNSLRHIVVAIASLAAHYPWTCICLVTIMSASLLGAGLQTNFRLELDILELFTPLTSFSAKQRKWVHGKAGLPGQSNRLYVPLPMVLHANGDNVITYEAVERILDAYEDVLALSGYHDICVSNEKALQINGHYEACEIHSIGNYWNHSRTWFEQEVADDEADFSQYFLKEFYPDGTTIDLDRMLGMTTKDHDNIPKEAQSLFLEVAIPLSRAGNADRVRSFAIQMEEVATSLRDEWAALQSPYHIEFAAVYNVAEEFQAAIFADLPLLPVVFIVMLAFTCMVFWKCNKVQSRLLLALGAVVTVVMSLMAGFGLMFSIGIPYTIVTSILAPIIFGIALDDCFIIMGAYERTDPKKTIEDRVRDTFNECGLSIIMTTLTTSLAFALGCISTVPAIRYLCLMAFPLVLIDFLFQITFFVALLVLDARRINANRMDCCVCVKIANSACLHEDDGMVTDVAQFHKHQQQNKGNKDHVSRSEDTEESSGDSSNDNDIENQKGPGQSTLSSGGIMRRFAKLLVRPRIKIMVLLAFIGMLAGCAYSATKLRQDFSFYDLLPDQSVARRYLAATESYGGINAEMYIFFRGMNQSDTATQDLMIDYLEQIGEIDHVELQPFCWIQDIRLLRQNVTAYLEALQSRPSTARVLETSPDLINFILAQGIIVQSMTFDETLDLIMQHPLTSILYGMDVKRNRITGEIHSSRCQVLIKDMDFSNVQGQINLLREQNKVTREHPINQDAPEVRAFLYKDLFHIWEFYEVAIKELKFTAFTGIATVSFFGFIFVPHWSAVLYIFPFMCILYIDLLGLFQMAGLTINVLTYVVLVVSVGLLVDFIMHMLLRYFESTKDTREQKVIDTLETMGSSLMLGGVSTFLATLPLMLSKSMVFRTIFYAFVSMIGLGVSHGLILLPVILSMFGTHRKVSIDFDVSDDNENAHELDDHLLSLEESCDTSDDNVKKTVGSIANNKLFRNTMSEGTALTFTTTATTMSEAAPVRSTTFRSVRSDLPYHPRSSTLNNQIYDIQEYPSDECSMTSLPTDLFNRTREPLVTVSHNLKKNNSSFRDEFELSLA